MFKKFFSLMFLAFLPFNFFSGEPLKKLVFYESSMTVYGERIPVEQKEIVSTPAPIIIISQDEIKEKGFKTFSEIVENAVGALGRDLTGNPIERSVDLRGFPDGTSLVVFIDGVKLNNISDNSINFEIIPVEIIDRVEIYSGAVAPLYGGGAIGGVINIITKKGEAIPRLNLIYGIGTFGERNYKTDFSFSKGKVDLFSAFSLKYSEGYRENDGYRLDDGFFKMNYNFDGKGYLSFLMKYDGGSISAPGALTEEEIKEDRKQSPYNKYDGSRGRHKIYALTFSKEVNENANFVVETFSRSNSRDILTTGRYLSGFQTTSNEYLNGVVTQFSQSMQAKKGTFLFYSSLEYQKGRNISKGYYTDFFGENISPATSTKTKEEILGGYLSFSYILSKFKFDFGYRKDRAKYNYTDFFFPSNNRERSFIEGTNRASISYFFSENEMAFVAFSEGYKIPTVIDLFAYPGFYSNPDLIPSRVNDYEIGYKFFGEKFKTKVTIYKMFLRDEVVFVLTNPQWFIGMNKNIGKSYRKGLEGVFSLDLPKSYFLSFSATMRNAEVTEGLYTDKKIPMVPQTIANISLAKNFENFFFSFGSRYVGKQYLDNDLSNQREILPSFFVSFLNFNYKRGPISVELKVDNLFNKKYSTRGITNGFKDFFNPAYPFSTRLLLKYSF